LKTIDLVYFNAGGGHRSAAVALESVVRDQARPWRVRLVNLFEVLDPGGLFYKTTGMMPEDYYNTRLKRGWTLGLAQELKILQALIRLSHRSIKKQLQRHWRATAPDMVVSLVPNFNRAMYQALMSACPSSVYVTLMTDFADYPPHFWIEPNQSQHFICGTPRAMDQARALGYGPGRIHATSGMIIRPDFYSKIKVERRAEMRRLNLDPDRPTGIVMFGAHGSRTMKAIARKLDETQLILICGHNTALADQLRELPAAAGRVIVGFTPEIRYYMNLCDFFIGKPGPGSVSEAVQQGLPVLVVRNAWTMPQERYNADWILENQVGVVLDSFRFVRGGVERLIAGLDQYRASLTRIQNRAIYEIPDIFERLLETDRSSAINRRAGTHN
jgi:hypothetical protein